ncbi:MAG: Holliday junction ATP-dependent DNA helicase RuvA [Candidatus Uhrbacteria bacterium GW2011_GWF2_41_16]|uniref:Holliday junction branch migration complex subunit RuvA n=2 Tax=Candidatus Uhriibacteriota TaxID=1752732 RepID=A0A0G0XL48_9BACT|nr:MAG: Holliday junction ATP-dependent DNA helicase RuvA [Candidatus Uhrbacteria bacterium GW2011_GWC2_41_11]KKR97515.1 MAG: Holliday junction ATP-dependent DNA helicase RuvA [Candidatus Uhrbacteria bacterium GW2011_GWF2_41_16]
MLCFLSGTLLHHGIGYVIVLVHGVGYKVFLPEDAAHELSGEVTLYTHEVIRDDQRELFGFLSLPALELFWKLINVSGVGPRSAQKIVFARPVEEVKTNIMGGNLAFLMDIPGIGKKTAQKIILELKGVLAEEPSVSLFDQDALQALLGLGYTRRQAEEALSTVQGDTTEARVRLALKCLSR